MQRNVMDFGAVGDGRTDDRPAIQHAIDDAVENGGTVLLPARNGYRINGSLNLPDNCTLVGEYKWYGKTLARDPNRGLIGNDKDPVITTGVYPLPAAARFEHRRRNISLIGVAVHNENAPAVEFKSVDNFLIRDCLLSAKDAEALVMRFSPRGRVENCFISAASPGSRGVVNDADVPEAHGKFALSARDNCNGLTIDGCTISGGAGGTIDITHCQALRIVGCIMEVNGEYAIRITGPKNADGGGNCHGFEISGNYIEVAKFPICLGSYVKDPPTGPPFTGANAVLAGRIFGNYLTTRNNASQHVDDAPWFVLLERCVGVSITNNSFIGTDAGIPVFRFKRPSSTGSSLNDTSYDCEINYNAYQVKPAGLLYTIDPGYPVTAKQLLADNDFDFTYNRFVVARP